jgi:Rhodanese-like domain
MIVSPLSASAWIAIAKYKESGSQISKQGNIRFPVYLLSLSVPEIFMQKTKCVLALFLFMMAISACNPSTPVAAPTSTTVVIVEPTTPPQKSSLPASEAEVPRVDVAAAKAALDSGAAIILDVRSKTAYEASHIKGAFYIGDLEPNQTDLNVPKDQWIITYCT